MRRLKQFSKFNRCYQLRIAVGYSEKLREYGYSAIQRATRSVPCPFCVCGGEDRGEGSLLYRFTGHMNCIDKFTDILSRILFSYRYKLSLSFINEMLLFTTHPGWYALSSTLFLTFQHPYSQENAIYSLIMRNPTSAQAQAERSFSFSTVS